MVKMAIENLVQEQLLQVKPQETISPVVKEAVYNMLCKPEQPYFDIDGRTVFPQIHKKNEFVPQIYVHGITFHPRYLASMSGYLH